MSIAALVCRGIGPAGTPNALILGGLSPNPVATGTGLVMGGLGGTPSSLLLRGFISTPPTQQQVVCTTTSWTGFSLQENQSPAVAVGDTFYLDFITTPSGYPASVDGAGNIAIDAHADLSRQYLNADIFSVSLARLYGAFRVYFNNHAPQLVTQPPNIKTLVNSAVSLNFTTSDPNAVRYVIDQDGDPITSNIVTGALPAGLVLSGNTISGTPSAALTNDVTVRFSDALGATTDVTLNVLSDAGKVVPTAQGLGLNAAIAAVNAVGLAIDPVVNFQLSNVIPANTVISQSPAPGAVVFSDAQVTLFVSMGNGGIVPPGSPVSILDHGVVAGIGIWELDIGYPR